MTARSPTLFLSVFVILISVFIYTKVIRKRRYKYTIRYREERCEGKNESKNKNVIAKIQESALEEMKNEIIALKNTVKELVEMMKSVYEFEDKKQLPFI